LVSELSLTLRTAAEAHAGIAVLPRFLGDAAPGLTRLPRPDEPREALWLTVHEDARSIPRVHALLAFLRATFQAHGHALSGELAAPSAQGISPAGEGHAE
jgi:DNA-binding transcriptional LysR family regulator